MILIVDFGSQTAHLIGRRLTDMGIAIYITTPEEAEKAVLQFKPKGIILSGGPSSVYEKGAPTLPKSFFSRTVPMLGICYGWQLMAHLLGGVVRPSRKEYGPAQLEIEETAPLFSDIDSYSTVWMSHGDSVVKAPSGFTVIAKTPQIKFGAVVNQSDIAPRCKSARPIIVDAIWARAESPRQIGVCDLRAADLRRSSCALFQTRAHELFDGRGCAEHRLRGANGVVRVHLFEAERHERERGVVGFLVVRRQRIFCARGFQRARRTNFIAQFNDDSFRRFFADAGNLRERFYITICHCAAKRDGVHATQNVQRGFRADATDIVDEHTKQIALHRRREAVENMRVFADDKLREQFHIAARRRQFVE